MSVLPDGRYVDDAPYERDLGAEARNADLDLPNWRLVLRRFTKHRLAVVSGLFLLISYLLLPVAGFIAP